eukprot:CAMPEP_0171247410 /NCGR_PEP_ID=MMETSP0790-20130122/48481_1 /TAXON_ID=2925 /ORGANISM="Alexandrium catenella, Strain OF101" /LENGTH=70 /DNA_ID=CAMNT_0011714819 /DNA_START=94 /DNA_END=302 /DNA_ORIENTATION=+
MKLSPQRVTPEQVGELQHRGDGMQQGLAMHCAPWLQPSRLARPLHQPAECLGPSTACPAAEGMAWLVMPR